jgi:hypothetical protein
VVRIEDIKCFPSKQHCPSIATAIHSENIIVCENGTTSCSAHKIPLLGKSGILVGRRIETRSWIHRRGSNRMSECGGWIMVDGQVTA